MYDVTLRFHRDTSRWRRSSDGFTPSREEETAGCAHACLGSLQSLRYRFGSARCDLDDEAAPAEAPAAQRDAGLPLRRLRALLQRLTAAAARRPGPERLRGVFPGQTQTPAGPVLPGPAQRRPEPAVRQCRHEPGQYRPDTVRGYREISK